MMYTNRLRKMTPDEGRSDLFVDFCVADFENRRGLPFSARQPLDSEVLNRTVLSRCSLTFRSRSPSMIVRKTGRDVACTYIAC